MAAVVVPLLPAERFTGGFCGAYSFCATVIAMMVFFTGGTSSGLHVVFFPLLATALRGARRVVLASPWAVLFCYGLALLPGFVEPGAGEEVADSVFYRLGVPILTGVLLADASRGVAGSGELDRRMPEDGGRCRWDRWRRRFRPAGGGPSP